MNVLKTIRNFIFYCGIEKDEFNAIKKDAYISNYRVWRILQCLMTAVFGLFFINSFFGDLLKTNRLFYMIALIYSAASTVLFFLLKKDSLVAQLLIYLSISFLFLFACFISQNRPELPATTFIVFLLITPMFMIDKPYFMAFELCAASAVFLIWMHRVKPYEIWQFDMGNVITYTVVGIFLHVIANSIRIREFVLTRTINIQKDTDEMTGLKNKGALTREINEYLADCSAGRGVMLLLDVDRFKAVNDTYGHDIGDSVIRRLGAFLRDRFAGGEIAGRFGGDEFIVFIKDTDDPEVARAAAKDVVDGAAERVALPNGERISVSIGIALYHGEEKNYSEIFRKADTALYQAKADPAHRFRVHE